MGYGVSNLVVQNQLDFITNMNILEGNFDILKTDMARAWAYKSWP
jgi:hypothetical protein